MPINLPNFIGPVDKPDYSGFENLTKNFLESYHAPQRLKEERAAAKRLKEAEELAHYFKQTYGPRRNEAEIKFLESQANREATGLTPVAQDLLKAFGGQTPEFNEFLKNYYTPQLSGSRNGITPGLRGFNALPAAAREATMARYRGITGLSDPEIIQMIANGATEDDFRQIGIDKGIDVDKAKPRFAPTTPNITAQQKRQVVSAGSDVLNEFISKAYEPYVGTVGRYSWNQIVDHFKGDEDKLSDFYAARMLEEEAALQNVVKSGGNVNMHAVQNMIDKSMGNHKVIPAQMTPSIFAKTRQKAHDVMRRTVEAEQNALNGFTQDNNLIEQARGTLGQNEPATPIEEYKKPNEYIIVENPVTGKRERMTRAEAMKRGAQ